MHGENVPSDWYAHFYRCPDCGTRYHASEGHDCSEDRAAEDDAQREAVLARLPAETRATVRRLLAEIGEV